MSTQKKLTVTVKVGSNVITNSQGFPDEEVIHSISRQIKTLREEGHQVLLVTSGAVAAGRSIYQFNKKADTAVQRQVLASIGQVVDFAVQRSLRSARYHLFSGTGYERRFQKPEPLPQHEELPDSTFEQ